MIFQRLSRAWPRRMPGSASARRAIGGTARSHSARNTSSGVRRKTSRLPARPTPTVRATSREREHRQRASGVAKRASNDEVHERPAAAIDSTSAASAPSRPRPTYSTHAIRQHLAPRRAQRLQQHRLAHALVAAGGQRAQQHQHAGGQAEQRDEADRRATRARRRRRPRCWTSREVEGGHVGERLGQRALQPARASASSSTRARRREGLRRVGRAGPPGRPRRSSARSAPSPPRAARPPASGTGDALHVPDDLVAHGELPAPSPGRPRPRSAPARPPARGRATSPTATSAPAMTVSPAAEACRGRCCGTRAAAPTRRPRPGSRGRSASIGQARRDRAGPSPTGCASARSAPRRRGVAPPSRRQLARPRRAGPAARRRRPGWARRPRRPAQVAQQVVLDQHDHVQQERAESQRQHDRRRLVGGAEQVRDPLAPGERRSAPAQSRAARARSARRREPQRRPAPRAIPPRRRAPDATSRACSTATPATVSRQRDRDAMRSGIAAHAHVVLERAAQRRASGETRRIASERPAARRPSRSRRRPPRPARAALQEMPPTGRRPAGSRRAAAAAAACSATPSGRAQRAADRTEDQRLQQRRPRAPSRPDAPRQRSTATVSSLALRQHVHGARDAEAAQEQRHQPDQAEVAAQPAEAVGRGRVPGRRHGAQRDALRRRRRDDGALGQALRVRVLAAASRTPRSARARRSRAGPSRPGRARARTRAVRAPSGRRRRPGRCDDRAGDAEAPVAERQRVADARGQRLQQRLVHDRGALGPQARPRLGRRRRDLAVERDSRPRRP